MGIGKAKKVRVFDPHETARVEGLAGTPLASFWQRAVAFSIDFFIVLAFFIPFELTRQYLVLRFRQGVITNFHFSVKFDPRELEDLVFLIVYSGLSMWCTNGQTAGKRLLRIRVVSLTHPKISLWQAVERSLGYGASLLEGGFGFIQFFIHRNRQCVHDRIAETIVVRERASERLLK